MVWCFLQPCGASLLEWTAASMVRPCPACGRFNMGPWRPSARETHFAMSLGVAAFATWVCLENRALYTDVPTVMAISRGIWMKVMVNHQHVQCSMFRQSHGLKPLNLEPGHHLTVAETRWDPADVLWIAVASNESTWYSSAVGYFEEGLILMPQSGMKMSGTCWDTMDVVPSSILSSWELEHWIAVEHQCCVCCSFLWRWGYAFTLVRIVQIQRASLRHMSRKSRRHCK